jgi:hypothetical protein
VNAKVRAIEKGHAILNAVNILIIVLALCILWSLWGYFSSNVEQARYTVVRKSGEYEIRTYASHIEAQTTVNGSYTESLNNGFMIVAGYIFGGNEKKESIAMTSPVTAQQPTSETIAMTAPVVTKSSGDSRIVAFVMPGSYTLQSLPTPKDSRVKLVEVPEKTMAVLRFSWFRNDARILTMGKRLLSALADDNIHVISNPSFAGYNAPWTPPWMTRYEVMVEVQ